MVAWTVPSDRVVKYAAENLASRRAWANAENTIVRYHGLGIVFELETVEELAPPAPAAIELILG